MTRMNPFVAAAVAATFLLINATAQAAVTGFTGTLTTIIGTGSGLPAAPDIQITGSGVPTTFSTSSFSLASGVFATDFFAARTVPLPTAPNSIYVIGQVINASSLAGTLSAGSGPGGGFGGALNSGAHSAILLGITSVPGVVFGSLPVPLIAGLTGTTTATRAISANAVTVSVIANGWTTGVVTYDDRNAGTLAPTGGTPLANPFITSGTVSGTNNLGPNGGTITLVTPFVVRIPASGQDLRAGYSILQLTFIPEPGGLLLVGAGLLAATGWIKRRR